MILKYLKKIINIQEDESTLEDYEIKYNDFWKNIVEDEEGILNKDQIMRELFDYNQIIDNCSKAYNIMTQGIISKPLTKFEEVEKIFNENFSSKKKFDIYGSLDE